MCQTMYSAITSPMTWTVNDARRVPPSVRQNSRSSTNRAARRKSPAAIGGPMMRKNEIAMSEVPSIEPPSFEMTSAARAGSDHRFRPGMSGSRNAQLGLTRE